MPEPELSVQIPLGVEHATPVRVRLDPYPRVTEILESLNASLRDVRQTCLSRSDTLDATGHLEDAQRFRSRAASLASTINEIDEMIIRAIEERDEPDGPSDPPGGVDDPSDPDDEHD